MLQMAGLGPNICFLRDFLSLNAALLTHVPSYQRDKCLTNSLGWDAMSNPASPALLAPSLTGEVCPDLVPQPQEPAAFPKLHPLPEP